MYTINNIMKNLNICYFENKTSEKYVYYQDIKNSIKKQCSKFAEINSLENLSESINQLRFIPDALVIGFGATDIGDKELNDLEKLDIPKFIFLNKEYTRLDEKLSWIKRNNFESAFTVLGREEEFSEKSKTEFFRVNFAVNPKIYKTRKSNYKYDISFSGVIREEQDNNVRLRVMNELFQDSYWYSKKIIFSSHMNNSQKDYARHLSQSKVTFSSTGPADIIGTRYFEVMATNKSVLLCNYKDNIYNDIFTDKVNCLMFEHPSEIKKLFLEFVIPDETRTKILSNAYKNIVENHTWDHRAQEVLNIIGMRI